MSDPNVGAVTPKPANPTERTFLHAPPPTAPPPGNGARPRPGSPLQLARERSEQQQQATGVPLGNGGAM